MAIAEPSEKDWSEDEDDKVPDRLLDMAWDPISKRVTAGLAEKSKKETPTLELTAATQLPGSTNCLACSVDGRYIAMGHSQGLSVSCASSLILVSTWLQDSLEITSIQITCMGEMAYLLGTVDDMGVARIFAYHAESIHLLKIINDTEDVNQRSICMTFELSEGGDYGAASISWTTLKSPLEVLQKKDCVKVFASGQNHMISSRQWEEQDAVFRSMYRKYLSPDTDKRKEADERPRHCTKHFLLPCGLFPGLSEATSHPGLPVAVCVWWSGTHNLLQYLLCRTPKDKLEVEPLPELLWPNAHEILCSAVSSCTRYIALGLEDALVTVWDRQLVASADSAFTRMLFVDYRPVPPEDSLLSQDFTPTKVHLLVALKSGATHVLTTGRGTESCSMQLTERPKDSGGLPTAIAPVPFLQGSFLVVQKNGEMFLQDVINNTTVCYLIPPVTHVLATPWDPVYALDTKQQTLFIRGDQDPSHSGSVTGDCQSQLFAFRFGEPAVIEPYIVGLPDSPRQQTGMSFVALEEACNLYLQKRALSVDEREKATTQTWSRLQEHAVTGRGNRQLQEHVVTVRGNRQLQEHAVTVRGNRQLQEHAVTVRV
ncbi:WD repeat-containing protein 93 [Diretmus argenteus]